MDLRIDCDEFSAKANSRGIITIDIEDIDKRDLNSEDVAKCVELDTFIAAHGIDNIIAYIKANYELDQD